MGFKIGNMMSRGIRCRWTHVGNCHMSAFVMLDNFSSNFAFHYCTPREPLFLFLLENDREIRAEAVRGGEGDSALTAWHAIHHCTPHSQ